MTMRRLLLLALLLMLLTQLAFNSEVALADRDDRKADRRHRDRDERRERDEEDDEDEQDDDDHEDEEDDDERDEEEVYEEYGILEVVEEMNELAESDTSAAAFAIVLLEDVFDDEPEELLVFLMNCYQKTKSKGTRRLLLLKMVEVAIDMEDRAKAREYIQALIVGQ